eukprot:TRINITY_DN12588_c0_g1_i2.p1 TRINITY_DN12588_c0_g1~~TRINITY_DN12588_c0_g1_i2.p1  ORF type:complete len:185 (+),score=45.24 TRINITY_DN12588_c0_g1_i2:338-892(+)
MNEPEVVQLLKRYDNTLKTLFEFYVKLDTIEAYKSSETGVLSLPYKSFIRLVNQQRLTPGVVSKDEILIIYKLLMKNKVGKIGPLNFEEFIESLVRIAIKGKDKMNAEENKPQDKPKSILLFDMEGVTVNTLEELFKYMKLSPQISKRLFVKRLTELRSRGIRSEVQKRRQSASKEKNNIQENS